MIHDVIYEERFKEGQMLFDSVLKLRDLRKFYLSKYEKTLREWLKDYISRLEKAGFPVYNDPLFMEPLYVIDLLTNEFEGIIKNRVSEGYRIFSSLFDEQQTRIDKYKDLLSRDTKEREFLTECIDKILPYLPDDQKEEQTVKQIKEETENVKESEDVEDTEKKQRGRPIKNKA